MMSQPGFKTLKMGYEGSHQRLYTFSSSTIMDGLREAGGWSSSTVFPARTELFRQGSWAQVVYLIERGLVKVTAVGSNAKEAFLGLYAQGLLLGANAVLLQRPLSATAETITPCQVCYVPAEDFRYGVKTNPQFSWNLHCLQSLRVNRLNAQRISLKWLTARQRLEQFLWEMLSAQDTTTSADQVRFQIPLKRSEISQLITVTRQHLARLLNELERDGILRRAKGWFIIPEPEKLWHWTDY